MESTGRAVAVALALLASGCAGGMATPANESPGRETNTGRTGVLLGRATQSPTSPVQRVGEAAKEAPTPGVKLEIKDASGQKAASIVTDDKGEYRISLVAGTYRVELGGVLGPGISKDLPATVSITEGKESRLDIRFDTGIR